MSRFEEVQNLLMDGEFESGLDYFTIHDYLRDLKASHDALLVAGNMYMDRVSVDVESNYELEALYAMIEALKAAEALR